MDAIAFLRKILPPQGVYYAATPKSFVDKAGKTVTYYGHVAFHDIPALANEMLAKDSLGITQYHACSAFKQEFYMEYDAARGKDRARSRTAANARAAKAFWSDLDCGEGKDYPDQKSALYALLTFCKNTGFPFPMVVLSGYGVHAYWPLETELLAPSWKETADVLKRTMIACGVRLDPARGGDIASVLRTPGTHNWKDPANPKPVTLYKDGGPFNTAELVEKIRKIAKKHDVVVREHKKKAPSDAEGGLSIAELSESKTGDANKIADACAHMSEMRQTKGLVTEPIWYAALGVLNYCIDGEEFAQDWSSEHEDYDPDHVAQKMEQWKAATTGPATCAYFESKSSCDKCRTCRFKGQITSPVQLGAIQKEAPKVDEEGREIIPPPFPFTRAEDGIYITIDKIADIKKRIYSTDIYISDILRNNGYEQAVVQYKRPHEGWATLTARTSLFNKLETSWQWFSDNGIYITSKESAEGMALYMRSYLAELHQKKEALASHSNLGWNADGSFVAGQALITKQGKITPLKSISAAVKITNKMVPTGSLEAWVKAGEIFNDPEHRLLGFAVLAGGGSIFGGPDSLHSAAVNLIGKTGLGKSTIQHYINSMWGHPEQMLLHANDTMNAIFKRVGEMNNLPITIDEVGNLKAEVASDMVLRLTQGKDKQTLTQTREERTANEWNTIAILSSNHSLQSKVQEFKDYSGAENARLIEIFIEQSKFFMDPDAPKHFNRTLFDNHGKAGLFLARHLVRNGDRGRSYLDQAEVALKKWGINFTGPQRYLYSTFLKATAYGICGAEIGLIKFDYKAAVIAMHGHLCDRLQEADREAIDAFDQVSMFTNQFYDKILTVEYGYQPQPIITHDTRGGEIVGRMTVWRNKAGEVLRAELALSASEMRSWLNRKLGNIKQLTKDLSDGRGLLAERQQVSLGLGTHYQVPPRACFVVNLLHPRFQSTFERVGVELPAIPVEDPFDALAATLH